MKITLGILIGMLALSLFFALNSHAAVWAVTKIADCGIIMQSDVRINAAYVNGHRVGICVTGPTVEKPAEDTP